MNGPSIAIGSRGSALALAQARLVGDALAQRYRTSRIVIIETEGDRRAPDTAWGEGAFVAAIERALIARHVDLAVHSAKDVPTEEDPRLRIAAYLPRADPRDALVVRSDARERRLADLRPGARVGTDSPRRTGFLLAKRSDLVVHPLHGNVDTRLRRLEAGETDALVLACAGLDRMGLSDRIAERLQPDLVPPAAGQGAIAIQVRRHDARMLELAEAVDDRRTRHAVEAERAFLKASGGGCRAPIGALATIVDDELDLLGGYVNPDGSGATFARRRGPVAAGEDIGRALAAALSGAARAHPTADHVALRGRHQIARRVLVTRAAGQADELVSALRDAGLDPVTVPAIAVEFEPSRGALDAAVRQLRTYRWIVITSANGALAIVAAAKRTGNGVRGPSWAAIGPQTRRVLEGAGIDVDFEPRESSRIGLIVELDVASGDRVLVVRGDLSDQRLAVALGGRGAAVDDVIGYCTREAPETSRTLLRTALNHGPIAGAVLTSGSTVRGLLSLGRQESIDVRTFPAVCIGPETAREAREAGFQVLAVSPTPDSAALAAATVRALAHQQQERS